jgi:D-alanyl-lipoteichoic acid acyltransferase DltB (MBOAT superfamily)
MPVLILLSLCFYAYWEPRFLLLITLSIVANWLVASLYDRTRRGTIIALAIIANLFVLGFFKYSAFFAQNVAAATGFGLYFWKFALPLGISFFTFHHIMYLVDLKRGRAPTFSLQRYALYICFFPQAISGPLARWNEVMEQFGQRAFGPGWERRVAEGAMFIVAGLVAKVLLADPLARALDPIYKQAESGAVPVGEAWAALGFAFQVFFDFSGYSDIAIGLGLIFGVRLPLNFDGPFRTTSMLDFWQCWHMTLARFLRDYVFTPLTKSSIIGDAGWLRWTRVLLALLMTMALCGLWHGAGWTFVIWGISQGAGLIFAAAWRRHLPGPPPLIGWAATIAYVTLTAVFFRAPTLHAAWNIFASLESLPGLGFFNRDEITVAAFCAIVLPPSHRIISHLIERPSAVVAFGMAAMAAYCVLALRDGEPVNFIYFQF